MRHVNNEKACVFMIIIAGAVKVIPMPPGGAQPYATVPVTHACGLAATPHAACGLRGRSIHPARLPRHWHGAASYRPPRSPPPEPVSFYPPFLLPRVHIFCI